MSASAQPVTQQQLYGILAGRGIDEGLASAFDSGVFSTNGANKDFLLALGNARNQRCIINILGDGIAEGYYSGPISKSFVGNSTDSPADCWGTISQSLQSTYGDGGSGYQQFYDPALFTGPYGSPFQVTPGTGGGTNPTYNSTANVPPGTGIQLGKVGAGVDLVTRGKHVVVFIVNVVTGGKLDIIVDGVTLTNIATASASPGFITYTSPTLTTTPYANAPPDIHLVQLRVTDVTGSATVSLMGVGGYNDTGVVINRFCAPNLTLQNVVACVDETKSFDSNGALPFFWNTISGTNMADNYSSSLLNNTLNISHIPYFRCHLFVNMLNMMNPRPTIATTPATDDIQYLFRELFKGYNQMKQCNSSINFLFVQPVAGAGPLDGGESSTTALYNTYNYAAMRTKLLDLMYIFTGIFIDLNLAIAGAQSYGTLANQGFWSAAASDLSITCSAGQPMGSPGIPRGSTGLGCNAIYPSKKGHLIMVTEILPLLTTRF